MFGLKKWVGKEDDALPVVHKEMGVRSPRIGMDKNFRVGRVTHISADRSHILIDVMETCYLDDGTHTIKSYNLWIYVDSKWSKFISKAILGRYVVVGFYIQSFRNKDKSDSFDTVMVCRFFKEIDDQESAEILSLEISESNLFIHHPLLKKNVNF